jgi:hypothetical protein
MGRVCRQQKAGTQVLWADNTRDGDSDLLRIFGPAIGPRSFTRAVHFRDFWGMSLGDPL